MTRLAVSRARGLAGRGGAAGRLDRAVGPVPRGAGGPWVELTVETSAQAAEAAGAILQDLRCGGLVEEQPSADRCRFRCYLPPSGLLPVTLRGVRARVRGLAAFGLDPGSVRITHRTVAGRRWVTAWRRHVRPVRIGRLVVRPSWIRVPMSRGRVAIEIDPGMAFGTGLHPSTRLCLRALLAQLPHGRGAAPSSASPRAFRRGAGPVVFDVGAGSGILAIAAARLGAASVWAVDRDPVAVAVARENARHNGVVSRVRVTRGDGLAGAPGRADLILANIIAETVISMLPGVRRRLAPGGVFVGSGIVAECLRDVRRAARRAGLVTRRVLAEGVWRAVVCSTPRRG